MFSQMNQTCKVCGEPAAGFHFGAFTCEGCKSFFGRSYNNLSSISDCKNNGECIINKKNRTACKACRLKKCLMVGMSKSGSRYGRRSNWFKIHCLLQEQQQQAVAAMAAHHNSQQAGGAANAPPGAAATANGCVKSLGGVPTPSAAAAALGMLGHAAGGYPGLLLKPTPEQQQAAVAAAAVQHLFNSSNASGQRFGPQLHGTPPFAGHKEEAAISPNQHHHANANSNNNSHLLPNGGKATVASAADELTKRFYLDAVLKSQQHSPPPLATKLPPHSKQDYSISALVTPNSESGRERVKSRQSNGDGDEDDEEESSDKAAAAQQRNVHADEDEEEEEEDLVVSMTPPRSPAQTQEQLEPEPLHVQSAAQDNPIDLSMKTTGSSGSSCQDVDAELYSDNEAAPVRQEEEQLQQPQPETEEEKVDEEEEEEQQTELQPELEDNSTSETVKTSIEQSQQLNNNNNNNNNSSNNNNNHNSSNSSDNEASDNIKRKLNELIQESTNASNNSKRLRLDSPPNLGVKLATSNALDLTTKV
ncbi:hypothetical protein KR093_007533 [Drosophila rubida]|uniref:Nuclear receptor domain-containing protein n=1 Tax=Drosophila rubida TaxID=30044 RepID=A0AAD4K2X0_9MUSC|nr:hypothetical protein KR093_007533 [Drosophila rubida]